MVRVAAEVTGWRLVRVAAEVTAVVTGEGGCGGDSGGEGGGGGSVTDVPLRLQCHPSLVHCHPVSTFSPVWFGMARCDPTRTQRDFMVWWDLLVRCMYPPYPSGETCAPPPAPERVGRRRALLCPSSGRIVWERPLERPGASRRHPSAAGRPALDLLGPLPPPSRNTFNYSQFTIPSAHYRAVISLSSALWRL